MIYVIAFISSLIFIRIACAFRKNNKPLFWLFSIVGILIPCLLAAFRDLSIGTDVKVYIKPLFDSASWYGDFQTYFLHPNSMIDDVLYLLMTFICRKISSHISLLFFVIEVLVMVPVYVALLRSNRQKNNSVVLGMFIFFMFFYHTSFNMARQSIALSFSILAMTYLDDNKNIKFLILSIIAFLFHNSAIILFPVFIFYKYKNKLKENSFHQTVIEFLVIIAILFAIAFLPKIISVLISLGIDSTKFSSILSNFSRSLDIPWVNTAFYLFICWLIVINRKMLKDQVTHFNFYSFMSFICILILQLGAVVKYSERIGYYIFYPILFLVLPKLAPFSLKKMTKLEFRNLSLVIGIFIAYWGFWIVLQNYHETFPYVFFGG